jgi:hypothetical protein
MYVVTMICHIFFEKNHMQIVTLNEMSKVSSGELDRETQQSIVGTLVGVAPLRYLRELKKSPKAR